MQFKIVYAKNGQTKTVIISAKDINSALKKFRNKYKAAVIDITEYHPKSLKDKIFDLVGGSKVLKINQEELVSVFSQLQVMLDAGLPIDMSLENVTKGIINIKLKQIFRKALNNIKAGFGLYYSFAEYQRDLGYITISMIKLGEETGDIAGALKDLVAILEEILDNKKRLKKAVRYPIFVTIAMAIAFIIIILYVVPTFQSVFDRLGQNLPLPTKMLLWLEHTLQQYGLLILALGFFVFLVLNFFYKKNFDFKNIMDRIILKLYLIGKIIHLSMIGRFLFVFQRLIEAGFPVVSAVEASLNIVENEYIKNKLIAIKENIVIGGTITNGMKETELFEDMIVQMVQAGEESGALSQMLEKSANYYLEKYRNLVDNISAYIEPLMTAAIAVFIFILALGIFLPMWDLTSITNG